MKGALLGLCLCGLAFGQTARVFRVTAELGQPVLLGHETFVAGSKERVESATLRELTLSGAELGLVFPNRVENVVATKDEKLLILRGSIRNPEKTTHCQLGPSDAIAFALWQRYRMPGRLVHVAHYDPVTLKHLRADLKPGESAQFVGVWRVPADLADFRMGMVVGKPGKIGWYDLTPVIRRVPSVFAAEDGMTVRDTASAAAGQSFSLDGLEMRVVRSGFDAKLGGYVVSLQVTNREHLLPVRWGWQYLATGLVVAGGAAPPLYPNLVDEATGQAWAGDLAPGATMTARLLFSSAAPVAARALRLGLLATGRTVEVELR